MEKTNTKSNKKKIITIVVVSIVVVVLAFVCVLGLGFAGIINMSWLFGSNKAPTIDTDYDINYDDLCVYPTVTSSLPTVNSSTLSFSQELTDDHEVLKSVSYLYNLANQNLIDMDYYACVAYAASNILVGSSSAGNSESREYIVKDNEEWFYQNYVLANVSGASAKIIKDIVESSEERYTNNAGVTIYKRHGGSASLSNTCIEDFLTDKSPILYENMAKQNKKHGPKQYTTEEYNTFRHVRISYDEIDNALIYAGDKDGEWYSTLTQASLTYDASKKLYTIVFDVDISNDSEALENGRKNLSAQSGNPVYYEKQHQTITIWENGLFCSYHTENKWVTSTIGIKYGSENNYQKFFTYNKANVNKLVIPSDTSWTNNCLTGVQD